MNVAVTASLIAGVSLIPALASAQPFPTWGNTALIGASGVDGLGNPTYSKNFPWGIPSPGFVAVQTMAASGKVAVYNGSDGSSATGTFKTSVSTATPISQLNSAAVAYGTAVISFLSFFDTFTIVGPPNRVRFSMH